MNTHTRTCAVPRQPSAYLPPESNSWKASWFVHWSKGDNATATSQSHWSNTDDATPHNWSKLYGSDSSNDISSGQIGRGRSDTYNVREDQKVRITSDSRQSAPKIHTIDQITEQNDQNQRSEGEAEQRSRSSGTGQNSVAVAKVSLEHQRLNVASSKDPQYTTVS